MSTNLSANSSITPSIEARHIYQHRNNLGQSRADLVEFIPPSHIYEDEYDYEEPESEAPQFHKNTDNRYIQKKQLKVKFDQNDQPHQFDQNDRNKNHNYDPWKDIYVTGNFDRKVEQKKADRKSSLEYTEYAEDDENGDYEYIDDEDLVKLVQYSETTKSEHSKS